MSKTNRIQWKRAMAVTVVLILLMGGGSFIVTNWINKMEEKSSFDRLYEETGKLAQNIEAYVKNDREQLEMIAAVIAGYQDLESPRLWRILDSYTTVGMMSQLGILLPNDTVLTKGGQRFDAKGTLSFEKEAALGSHITDRETALAGGEYILRHYVPVVRDGEIIAMLYGIVKLGDLPKELLREPYGGKAAVYIIEGNTGDFLVDTWHQEESGNIWSLGERPMAPGYDHEQLKQGLTDGKTGYVVFVSKTIGEYLYFYYEPMEINEWRIALSVPESLVFSDANAIRNILNAFLLLEAICFILYFLWMLHYVRRETSEKQHQLDTIHYIYDVERLLFNAHEKQENIALALEQIAHITSAERVSFVIVGQPTVQKFIWEEKKHETKQEKVSAVDSRMMKYFEEGNRQFEAYDQNALQQAVPAEKLDGLKSLMSVAVEDIGGKVCGVLTACNMPVRQADVELLKNVAFSFSMFYHNMQSYHTMKEQGEKDTLTGLYNRNRYELELPKFLKRYRKSLACIYIDVNGLHELNNSKGHEAGDEMLKTVARRIQEIFGTEYTYRIGGDEFLIFAVDCAEDMLIHLSEQFQQASEKEEIYVSVGLQWEKEVSSLDDLIKAAEKKMYTAKREYYEKRRS